MRISVRMRRIRMRRRINRVIFLISKFFSLSILAEGCFVKKRPERRRRRRRKRKRRRRMRIRIRRRS